MIQKFLNNLIFKFIFCVILLIFSLHSSQKVGLQEHKTDLIVQKSLQDPQFSNDIDSLKLYYRQCKLLKLSKKIYSLEPKLKENSYEMGILVQYKALLFEELNDDKNYLIATNRLIDIEKNLSQKDQKIMLQYYIISNEIAALDEKKEIKKLRELLQKTLDILENVSPNYRNEDYYFFKGSATYLMSISYVETKDYHKADSINILTKKNLDSTKSSYYRIFYNYTKGIIFANQKQPEKALIYYHNILKIAGKNKATRFLRNVYPMFNTSYTELGNFKEASNYMLKYKMTNDTILYQQNLANEYVTLQEKNIETKTKQNLQIKIVIAVLCLLLSLYFLVKFLWEKYTTDENLEDIQKQRNPFADIDVISEENLNLLVTLSKTDEVAFYLKFAECNPKLHKQLNTAKPKLSESEIKFCCYQKMNYTVKEIAIYTNSSIKSVASKKYRLKKKLKEVDNKTLYKKLNF